MRLLCSSRCINFHGIRRKRYHLLTIPLGAAILYTKERKCKDFRFGEWFGNQTQWHKDSTNKCESLDNSSTFSGIAACINKLKSKDYTEVGRGGKILSVQYPCSDNSTSVPGANGKYANSTNAASHGKKSNSSNINALELLLPFSRVVGKCSQLNSLMMGKGYVFGKFQKDVFVTVDSQEKDLMFCPTSSCDTNCVNITYSIDGKCKDYSSLLNSDVFRGFGDGMFGTIGWATAKLQWVDSKENPSCSSVNFDITGCGNPNRGHSDVVLKQVAKLNRTCDYSCREKLNSFKTVLPDLENVEFTDIESINTLIGSKLELAGLKGQPFSDDLNNLNFKSDGINFYPATNGIQYQDSALSGAAKEATSVSLVTVGEPILIPIDPISDSHFLIIVINQKLDIGIQKRAESSNYAIKVLVASPDTVEPAALPDVVAPEFENVYDRQVWPSIVGGFTSVIIVAVVVILRKRRINGGKTGDKGESTKISVSNDNKSQDGKGKKEV